MRSFKRSSQIAWFVIGLSLVWVAALAEADEFGPRMVRATHKLFNPKSTGTCFLLHEEGKPERPLIVSAAHVFEKMNGEKAVLVLREEKEEGVFQRRDFEIAVREGDQPLWTKHPDEDVAVLPLESSPDFPVSSLPMSVLGDEESLRGAGIDVCSRLFVCGFPTRLEANEAGFPIVRGATLAGFPIYPVEKHARFQLDFNTFEGDSGGPVFTSRTAEGNEPLIVGIAIAQYRNDETIRSMYEERTIHHPLSLGIVVHALAIRQTIERCLETETEDVPVDEDAEAPEEAE